MNMDATHCTQPHQIYIGPAKEDLDSQINLAQNMCSDVKSICGTVRILLKLCKDKRKIDPVDLSGILTMLDNTLDGTEDFAYGLRTFLDRLTPVADLEQDDGRGKGELRIVPAMSAKN